MRLFLPDGVYAVTIGDDHVFLDTVADTYFCLAGGADVLALGPDGAVEVMAEAAVDDLLQADLLSRTPGEARNPLPPTPTRSLRGPDPGGPMPWGLAIKALAVTLRVRRAVARRPFADLLEARHEGLVQKAGPTLELEEAVARFERLRPWLPIEGLCLLRSYHLRAFLRACGLDARWVFGVRTWPFAAHCWLQVGATVLDEDLERLVAYTPIMAVVA